MRPSKAFLYSRLFMQLLIIFLGFMILVQGLISQATFIYDFIGAAIILYGMYRLYGTILLLFGGKMENDR